MLQPAQAEVVLGQLSMYLASWMPPLPPLPPSTEFNMYMHKYIGSKCSRTKCPDYSKRIGVQQWRPYAPATTHILFVSLSPPLPIHTPCCFYTTRETGLGPENTVHYFTFRYSMGLADTLLHRTQSSGGSYWRSYSRTVSPWFYCDFCIHTLQASLPEVGKVTFKSNGDEALSDDSL
jgi:hypothetical protein